MLTPSGYPPGLPLGYRGFQLGACPAPAPVTPPGPPPPRPKYVRYNDPALQESYARIVAVLRQKSIPIIGNIFSDDEADVMARNALDAVRALPQSAELKERALCAATPIIVGLGLALTTSIGLSVWALARTRKSA